MKATIVLSGLITVMMSVQVSAQEVENDDMYFTAKDREKLRVAVAETSFNSTSSISTKQQERVVEETEELNPTDSYSARSINPEYISRSNSTKASEDEQNYYLEGYNANVYDSYSSSVYSNPSTTNSNCNCWNSYPNSYYGASAWNSYNPYYGYSNPWMSPYYGYSPGWNMSLGYMFGGWGSGWNLGLSYTWGNSYYNNPYNYYGYNPYYYSPYYYSNRGNTSRSIPEGITPKRMRTVGVTPTQRVSSIGTPSDNTNGRIRSTDDYYVKPNRRQSSFNSDYSNPLYQRNSTSEIRNRSNNNSGSGFERFFNDSSPSRNSGSSFDRSRSFSSPSSSPSRSSSPSISRQRGNN